MKLTDLDIIVTSPPAPGWGGRYWILVKLTTDSGLVGWGECYASSIGPDAMTHVIRDVFDRHMLGENPENVEKMFRRAYSSGFTQRPDLTVMGAFSGLEIACWDILGKDRDRPVWALIGGMMNEHVRAYTYLYPLPHHDQAAFWTAPDLAAETAIEMVKKGYTAVKFDPAGPYTLRGGHMPALSDISLSVAFCKTIREAVGDKADLLFGTHGQFTTGGAIRLGQALEPYSPLWFEEPLPPDCVDEMAKVARTIERVAPTNVSVMLLGASGTGKELLARGVHDCSVRKDGSFVAINCAAIPENLLESELFGHEKGAFTGAVKTTPGKIELADGGTLFLDEVGDIPLPLQVKLLRFLQERTIERVGGRKAISVDTRIVCATHQDLEAMIGAGTFREDLFYRLAEIVVKVPPLSDRPGDAVLLAKHFLTRLAKEMNPQVKGFAPDALAAIDSWAWPGNVRELENRVKRAVIMADGKLVTAEDLDLTQSAADGADIALNLKAAREQADRRMIRQALARSEGNISNTAKLLGISRPTLYDLLKQYDLHA